MDFKKLLPHLIAVGVLMLVSAVYFAPNAFSGKVLEQPDNDRARALQTESREYLEKDGKAPLWTNSPFGGMPAYQIYSPVQGNLTKPVYKTLFLWTDYTAVWAQVFGRTQLGRIQGSAQMLTVLASAIGPLLLAKTHAWTGS